LPGGGASAAVGKDTVPIVGEAWAYTSGTLDSPDIKPGVRFVSLQVNRHSRYRGACDYTDYRVIVYRWDEVVRIGAVVRK
jgi:hypothetical protein